MGGEWGIGASLAMEKAPRRSRGMLSGLLQEGYATGYLLAAICYFFVFPRWGWRPMFFIGGLPALLALFVRFRVEESEVWQRTRHKDWSSLGRGIASHWKLFLYLTLLMAGREFASPAPHHRAFAGQRARLSSRIRLPVRRPHRQLRRVSRGAARDQNELRQVYGDSGGDSVFGGGHHRLARTRATRSGIRRCR